MQHHRLPGLPNGLQRHQQKNQSAWAGASFNLKVRMSDARDWEMTEAEHFA